MSNDAGSNTPHQLAGLETRLERIEGKLDDHLQRVSAAERDIEWLRGHVRTATAIVLAGLAGMAAILSRWLFSGR